MTAQAREDWLRDFAEKARPLFAAAGLEYPADLRIGAGDLGKKKAGASYAPAASSVGASEITISLRIDQTHDVAGTLVHELIHAAGIRHHRPDFRKAGLALGLVGKPSAMGWPKPGDVPLWARIAIEELGPYPAGRIAPAEQKKKPQSTRMIRVECASCSMVWRTTRKWIEGRKLRCPTARCKSAGLNIDMGSAL